MRKAWAAVSNSGLKPSDHFVVYNEMVPIGSNAERQVDTVKMTRFACYLTVQNADSSKQLWLRHKRTSRFKLAEPRNCLMLHLQKKRKRGLFFEAK